MVQQLKPARRGKQKEGSCCHQKKILKNDGQNILRNFRTSYRQLMNLISVIQQLPKYHYEPTTIKDCLSNTISKKQKSPQYGNLDIELFTTDQYLTGTILQPMLYDIWKNTIPNVWNHKVVVKIPKEMNDCNYWGGITLLSIPSQNMARIII